jgi:hypothetical protein
MTPLYRVVPVVVVAALAGLLAGCAPSEGVTSYTVPTPAKVDEPPPPERTGDYRILGGVFPADDPAWFFKLAGKAADLAPFEAGFDQMLRSVRFPNGLEKPPEFDVPTGWTRTGSREAGMIRVADTIKLPGSELEVTVTQSGGGLDVNLERWAVKQLGGPKLRKAEYPKITREIDTGKVKGLWVDLRGPNNPSAKMMSPK